MAASINESQGIYDHLSLHELEQKLIQKEGMDACMKEIGSRFTIAGPTANQLLKLIEERKAKNLQI